MNNLKKHNNLINKEINIAIKKVLESGYYVMGDELSSFEKEFAEYCSTKHCSGVGNGTDALEIALLSIGIKAGDEIICTANAGFYSTAAIISVGAVPKYVDIKYNDMTMDPVKLTEAITKKTKGIIVTHLYGQMADMKEITKIAKRSKIQLIEDCAQAHGATLNNKKAGSWGDIGCFSFYPGKNLGALGDGGAITTSNSKIFKSITQLRQYGWGEKFYVGLKNGRNSRLDEIQAAILRIKLKYLDSWNQKRRSIACEFSNLLKKTNLRIPTNFGEDYVAHLYAIRSPKKKLIVDSLNSKNIANDKHYPIPDYAQRALKKDYGNVSLLNTEKSCKNVFTIPCYPELDKVEIKKISDSILIGYNK